MIHDPAWLALLARAKARGALADQYAAAGKGARFKGRGEGALSYLVTPDLESANAWRITTFGADGTPYGHMCYPTAFEAFKDAILYSRALPNDD